MALLQTKIKRLLCHTHTAPYSHPDPLRILNLTSPQVPSFIQTIKMGKRILKKRSAPYHFDTRLLSSMSARNLFGTILDLCVTLNRVTELNSLSFFLLLLFFWGAQWIWPTSKKNHAFWKAATCFLLLWIYVFLFVLSY